MRNEDRSNLDEQINKAAGNKPDYIPLISELAIQVCRVVKKTTSKNKAGLSIWHILSKDFRDQVSITAQQVEWIQTDVKVYTSTDSLKAVGFEAYVQINDCVLFLKKAMQGLRFHWEFAVVQDGKPMDICRDINNEYAPFADISKLSDHTCALIFFYLLALRDDFSISEQEDAALLAMAGLMPVSDEVVKHVKILVFTIYLRNAAADWTILKEEKTALEKLRAALDLEEDAGSKAVQRVLSYSINLAVDNGPVTKEKVEEAVRLAKELGIDWAERNLNPYDFSDWTTPYEIRKIRCAYFIDQCKQKKFPVIDLESFHLKKGEIAHFHSQISSVQKGTETKTIRIYVGTRVKIGNLPIFLGGSSPISSTKDIEKSVGEGHLVITNKRVVVWGQEFSYEIPLSKIYQIDDSIYGFQIHYSGRYANRFYRMPDSWAAKVILQGLLENIS